MDKAERWQARVALDDLYAAACVCNDAKLRGVILALACLHEGLVLSDVARIWRIDPADLREAIRQFDESGIDGLFTRGGRVCG